MPIAPPDLAAFFRLGHSAPLPSAATATVTAVAAAGDLALPSGRVVACDPLCCVDGPEPFTTSVPPGRYPVSASVVTISGPSEADTAPGSAPDTPHLRTAALRLVIDQAPPVSFELALVDGQRVADLAEHEFFGYGVDTGTGCFMDAEAVETFGSRLEVEDEIVDRAGWDALGDGLVRAVSEVGWDAPRVITDPASGHQLAAGSSGWGDGAYPTWIGRDAGGAVVWFVSDFGVLSGG